jgi:hypothetical protein
MKGLQAKQEESGAETKSATGPGLPTLRSPTRHRGSGNEGKGGDANNSLDRDRLIPKLVPVSDQTELDDGMLFRA